MKTSGVKSLEQYKERFGSVEFEGKEFAIVEDAQAGYDSKYGEIVYNATAITGEKDEFGEYKAYEVIWKISDPDAEDEMDACDWSEPYEVEDNGMGFDIETGRTF